MARKLTKKQEGFAKDYIETGNATLSVKQNYETTDENTAAAIGSKLLRTDKIREYLEDKAETAASIVFEIAQFGESDNVRLGASKDILDRAGFKPIEKTHNVNVNINEPTSERLQELADRLRNANG